MVKRFATFAERLQLRCREQARQTEHGDPIVVLEPDFHRKQLLVRNGFF